MIISEKRNYGGKHVSDLGVIDNRLKTITDYHINPEEENDG
jgi:hypothetical protein